MPNAKIFEIVNESPIKKPEDNETRDTVSPIYLRNKSSEKVVLYWPGSDICAPWRWWGR
jgi:hypothetical protein